MTKAQNIEKKMDYLTKELEKLQEDLEKEKAREAEDKAKSKKLQVAREEIAYDVLDYLIQLEVFDKELTQEEIAKYTKKIVDELLSFEKSIDFILKDLNWTSLKF